MICPASVSHHHAYPGGLFEHSVEVAEKLAQLVPNQSLESKDLAIVLGLIHDIGKVKTIKPNHQHGSLGTRVQHDALTLEVCSAGLSYLDAHLPQIAIEIRHCLTCSTLNSRYGFKPQSALALALQIADRESAEPRSF
ncbi:TraI domain-containing protein [Neiella marina]|uniref:TraI domain-containing protein n=2 Tax=Neiella holothuriorum TaxID=2870530 RepID=A0ABS7EEQ9_9GAMM|nr:TraI domain-containing protein [Neiella holothuriorum]